MITMRWIAPLICALAFQMGCSGDEGGGSDDEKDGSTQIDANICEATGLLKGPEICDGIDNDCNGLTDELFDKMNNPAHCGYCNHKCEFDHAQAACSGGNCLLMKCDEGWFDRDGNAENGCESQCSGTPEVCNGIDDDCDGETDEDFDFMSNSEHCGACNVNCARPNAQTFCSNGSCGLAGCEPGFGNFDGDPSNGCEAVCNPRVPGPELCDGEDNDCDGEIDEGFDFMTDGENCGQCGVRCVMANGAGACREGGCVLVSCQQGYVDADGDPKNGCEQRCEVTNNGVELCDGIDNDCDNQVDEDFDFNSDTDNCGGCGELSARYLCHLPNATTRCTEGSCELDKCVAGYMDEDGDPLNGCEQRCEQTNDGVEACDGVDNDCDGLTDEDFHVMSDARNCGTCGHACNAPNADVKCVGGQCVVDVCHDGWVDEDQSYENGCEKSCEKQNGGVELCNEIDDDCDGVVDDGFNLLTDPLNCGRCGNVCTVEHGTGFCNNGVCAVLSCSGLYVDLDHKYETGCECLMQNEGRELCNGIDDDCNGVIDDPDRMAPPQELGTCKTRGVCAGSTPHCVNKSWTCGYPDTYEEEETLCDGLDNDCDGLVDEPFELLHKPCEGVDAEGKVGLGICAERGEYICDGLHAVKCSVTAHPERAKDEECNGLDDNCNGETDENSQITAIVRASTMKEGASDFRIYVYEASRTDATSTSTGAMFDRACSKPGVLPWNNVDYATAVEACDHAGCHLCSEDEWSLACGGASWSLYPYGSTYDAEKCNGQDYDADPTRAGVQDGLLPCGQLPECGRLHENTMVLDMSGNLWEWTTAAPDSAGDQSGHALRGGGFGNFYLGLTCRYSLVSPDNVSRSNVGFRCCCPVGEDH